MAGVEIVGGEDVVLIVGLDAVDLFIVDLFIVDLFVVDLFVVDLLVVDLDLGIVPMCDVIDECDDD